MLAVPPTFSPVAVDTNIIDTSSVVVADVDRDGRDDLVISPYSGPWQQPDVSCKSRISILYQAPGADSHGSTSRAATE